MAQRDHRPVPRGRVLKGSGRRLALLLTALLVAGCARDDPPPPRALTDVVDELAGYWQDVADLGGPPELVVAQGDRDTGCGEASVDEGSFFCAEDATVYVQQVDLDDLAGLPDVERTASVVYLLAHEYGHLVQDRLGVDEGDAGPGPDGDSVRYELQADCLAGAFVGDRDDAASAAYREAVRRSGDDVGEDPLPEAAFEHGSARVRLEAFERGRTEGPQGCDLEEAA